MLLGALGQQKKEQGLDANGIASLLPQLCSMLGGLPSDSSGGGLSNITKLLDADQDGDILDDIKGFFGKITGKK